MHTYARGNDWRQEVGRPVRSGVCTSDVRRFASRGGCSTGTVTCYSRMHPLQDLAALRYTTKAELLITHQFRLPGTGNLLCLDRFLFSLRPFC